MKIVTNSPKMVTKSPPQIVTNFLKIFSKNIVMRLLKNFRIYGSAPSQGL